MSSRPSGNPSKVCWKVRLFSLEPLAQSALLIIIFFVPLIIMRGKSASYDEVAHLPAGFSYLTTGLVKLNPQHPPLIKEISALPLLFLRPAKLVDRRKLESQTLEPNFEWNYGRRFLFDQDADRLLFWGRIPVVFLSLGLAILVMLWARELWGRRAGLLALFLYAFDPTIMAHAQFVTTDVGCAFFATLFLFVLRRFLQHRDAKWLILSGITLGLALGAKFSAALLVPLTMVFLVAGHRQSKRLREPALGEPTAAGIGIGNWDEGSVKQRFLVAAMTIILMMATAAIVLWVIYIFPKDPFFYLKGLNVVNQDHHPDFPYYLMGRLKPGGWRSYFVIAWLIKTPLPSLVLWLLSLLLFLRGERAFWLEEIFLTVPALAFLVGYSLKADNIGVRYLIPCLPFFIIFTTRIVSAAGKVALRIPLALLLGWYMLEFFAISPDHLSYFNQIAGGYRHGPEWLDDSNVDWGQSLIELRDYLQSHKLSDYALLYFGSGEPEYYGIPRRNLTDEVPLSPAPGTTLILSGHYLARLRAVTRHEGSNDTRGLWPYNAVLKAVVGHAYYVYQF
jgi:dolichyl-phosphate-mannose-protein mannosyltransferase